MAKLPLNQYTAKKIIASRGYRDKVGRRIKNPTAYAKGMVAKTYTGRKTYSKSYGYRKRSYY